MSNSSLNNYADSDRQSESEYSAEPTDDVGAVQVKELIPSVASTTFDEDPYTVAPLGMPPAKPNLDIDIDDVIAQWQNSPSSSTASPAVSTPTMARNHSLQALRNDMGLPPLRIRRGEGEPQHPNHIFAFNTENMMCRQIHTPVVLPPKMPDLPQGKEVSFSSIPDKHITKASSGADSPTKIKLPRCAKCPNFCCVYADLLLTSTIKSRTAAQEHVRCEALVKLGGLRGRYPNGIEEYSTFLTCSECSCEVCPSCAIVCDELLCRQVVCKNCEADGKCPLHNFV